jgi:hypothetical protein
MLTRMLLLVCFVYTAANPLFAQAVNCTFKPPFFHMHFGRGNVRDVNAQSLSLYTRVASPCPTDGHYSYVSSTSDCFRGDWHTLNEDHTPGDAGGNMLLVNSAYDQGVFLTTRVNGFVAGKTYEFAVWLMNVCRPSDKCPFPLLPNLTIHLQTPAGKTVARFSTGEITRRYSPSWDQHKAQFTIPAAATELILTMTNNAPGGCGNDFAMDDITFRECILPSPAKVVEEKKQPSRVVTAKQPVPVAKKEEKKTPPPKLPVTRSKPVVTAAKTVQELPVAEKPQFAVQPVVFVPAPPVLKQRANPLAKQIETIAGELRIDVYDNGEIDGDTISIYHNNRLVVANQLLSQKPISFRIQVDETERYHELVMVAENLGSIPPNTSLMIVTATDKRHEVFISSTKQKNAKVVINLKE